MRWFYRRAALFFIRGQSFSSHAAIVSASPRRLPSAVAHSTDTIVRRFEACLSTRPNGSGHRCVPGRIPGYERGCVAGTAWLHGRASVGATFTDAGRGCPPCPGPSRSRCARRSAIRAVAVMLMNPDRYGHGQQAWCSCPCTHARKRARIHVALRLCDSTMSSSKGVPASKAVSMMAGPSKSRLRSVSTRGK